jgi:hypothetical protein
MKSACFRNWHVSDPSAYPNDVLLPTLERTSILRLSVRKLVVSFNGEGASS